MAFKDGGVRPRRAVVELVLAFALLGWTAQVSAQASPAAAQQSAWRAYQSQVEQARLLRDQVRALPSVPAKASQIASVIRGNLDSQRDAIQAGELRKARQLRVRVARQLRRVSRYVQRQLRPNPPEAMTLARLQDHFVRITEQALSLRDYAKRIHLRFDASPVKQARAAAKAALDAGDLAAARAAVRDYQQAVEDLHDALKSIPE